jgi:hypothetical protein
MFIFSDIFMKPRKTSNKTLGKAKFIPSRKTSNKTLGKAKKKQIKNRSVTFKKKKHWKY